MKKFLTLACSCVALVAAAQSTELTPTWTASQNYLLYATPNDVDNEADKTQQIVTAGDFVWGDSPTYRMQHFLVDCVVGRDELTKGTTSDVNLINGAQRATATLPSGAKIAGVALPGHNHGFSGTVKNLLTFVYVKNIASSEVTDGSYPIIDADHWYQPMLAWIKKSESGYTAVVPEESQVLNTIDDPSDEAETYCVNLMFNQPFTYTGQGLSLNIGITPADADGNPADRNNGLAAAFDFPRTKATASKATSYHTMRDGNAYTTWFNFYPGCDSELKDQIEGNFLMQYLGLTWEKAQMLLNYLNMKSNMLPAFQLTYYTNDVRGRITDTDGNAIASSSHPRVSLLDVTTGSYVAEDNAVALGSNSYQVDEQGNFCFGNLDLTHSYQLVAECDNQPAKSSQVFTFTNPELPGTEDYTDVVFNIGFAAGGTDVLLGDTNGDGIIDSSDVSLMISYILGNNTQEINFANADINADGIIDSSDVSGVIAIILGK